VRGGEVDLFIFFYHPMVLGFLYSMDSLVGRWFSGAALGGLGLPWRRVGGQVGRKQYLYGRTVLKQTKKIGLSTFASV